MQLGRGSVTLIGYTPDQVSPSEPGVGILQPCALSKAAGRLRKAVAEGSTGSPRSADRVPLATLIGVTAPHQKTSNQTAAGDMDIVLLKKEKTNYFRSFSS